VDASSSLVVQIRGVKKSFGANRVLDGVDLDVHKGEVVVVIGPSGSGKTTLLRCINLLVTYDEGSIQVDGVEVGFRDGASGVRRRRSDRELSRIRADIGMVFQLFNLFPHLTARENVMLGLRKVRGLSAAEAKRIAEQWLAGGPGRQAGQPAEPAFRGQQQRVESRAPWPWTPRCCCSTRSPRPWTRSWSARC
jgi:polar amino acid transport system ATP-binding protein